MKYTIFIFIALGLISCKDVASQAKPRKEFTLKVKYISGKIDTIKASGIDYEIIDYNGRDFSTVQYNYLVVSGRKVAKNVQSVSLIK